MRNFVRKIAAAIGGGLFLLAALLGSFPAFALTIPATFGPRMFQTQQTHYVRFTFNFNSCPGVLFGSSAGVNQQTFCSVKIGALPYNAYIVRAYQQTITAFNSGTTDSLSVGTASNTGGTLILGQAALFARTTTYPVNINTPIGSAIITTGAFGVLVTGNGTTPSGSDGGSDIFAQYQQTGATPTAGQIVIVIEYIAPNDGSCITPPLGSIPSAVGGPNAC